MSLRPGQRKEVAALSLADILRALERYTETECPEFFELHGVTPADGTWEIEIALGLTGYSSLHARAWFRRKKAEHPASPTQEREP